MAESLVSYSSSYKLSRLSDNNSNDIRFLFLGTFQLLKDTVQKQL